MSKIRNNNIWIFNAGSYFQGNPKWLFLYICEKRPDIKAVWLCDNEKTNLKIKKLGYKSVSFTSSAGKKIMQDAGVYVVEQFKENFHEELRSIKILNLWHGVGCKNIERKIKAGFLAPRIAKKHITNHNIYNNQQLFLTTSPLMERHFTEQCALEPHAILRGSYPRCHEKIAMQTFDHSILNTKKFSKKTRIVCYCPTYREKEHNAFFDKALPDFQKLIENLEENDLLFVLKVHPMIEGYIKYKILKDRYKNEQRIIFWNNENDFYEILDQIDIAIIDYSSIFYDLLAAGVPSFIRYFFDYEDNCGSLGEYAHDPKEMTCGIYCQSFPELLNALGTHSTEEIQAEEKERQKIHDLFFSYTRENNNEYLINSTLDFKIKSKKYPTLYTFDIFDTLIQRCTLSPEGIFFKTQHDLRKSDLYFPDSLVADYPQARIGAESNVRYFNYDTQLQRQSTLLEINFHEIFEHLGRIYHLNEEQIEFLKKSELEAEYASCQAQEKNIHQLLQLKKSGEDILLISDMYLPEDFIRKLLIKADTGLADIPIFLSSNKGTQKSNGSLYLEVFHAIDYAYSQWIHYGDNKNADGVQAQKLGITSKLHTVPEFNHYEQEIIDDLRNYDAYCIAALFARYRHENPKNNLGYYTYSRASLFLVTYVMWAVHDALERGTQCIYFIARDGHYLKLIADEIIQQRQLPLRTAYLYGSRKAWWLPSYINKIDMDFFANFIKTSTQFSFMGLLEGLFLSQEQFSYFFPSFIPLDDLSIVPRSLLIAIINDAQNNKPYHEYLLQLAATKRETVCAYLRSEINLDERFAFVEYWGRGYTQDCLERFIRIISDQDTDVNFYYARSIYRHEPGKKRYNFTASPASLIFAERFFANLPYDSTLGYEMIDGIPKPIIPPRECDIDFHRSMENEIVRFSRDLCQLPLQDERNSMRLLFDWCINHFKKNKDNLDAETTAAMSNLTDSTHSNGIKKELAPPLKPSDLILYFRGVDFKTSSLEISLQKSPRWLAILYTISNLPFFASKSAEIKRMLENQKKIQF